MVKKEKTEVIYSYKESPKCKTYHMDGVFGGTVTNGNINMNIFSETSLIPQKVVCDIENGKLIEKEKIPNTQNEVVREIQTKIVMSLHVAKSVKEWLEDKINVLEKQLKNR